MEVAAGHRAERRCPVWISRIGVRQQVAELLPYVTLGMPAARAEATGAEEAMRRTSARRTDRLLFPALTAVVLLLSPAVRVWAAPASPWWLLFVLWGSLIGLVAWSASREGTADDDRH